jgi:kynureninase
MNDYHSTGNDQPMPQDILDGQAKKWQLKISSEEFAQELDQNDPLSHVREEFYYPMSADLSEGIVLTRITSQSKIFSFQYLVDKSRTNRDSECIYLCGHSLGLQPKRVRKWIDIWLNDWARL